MRTQVWPRMVPTGEQSRFPPQANPANPPKTMAARKTMKLSTLLPKVGAGPLFFLQVMQNMVVLSDLSDKFV